MAKFYSTDSHPLSVEECNKIMNEDFDYYISLLESRQQDFDIFLMECKADVAEAKMISENASEEDLSSFREEQLAKINEFSTSSIKDFFIKIKDAVSKKMTKLKNLLTGKLNPPPRGKDVVISKSYQYSSFYAKRILSPVLLKQYIDKIKGSFNMKYQDAMKAKGNDIEDYALYFFNKFSQTNTSLDNIRNGNTDIANKVKVNIKPGVIPAKIVGEYLDLFSNDSSLDGFFKMYQNILDDANKMYKKVLYEFKMQTVNKEDKVAGYKVSGLYHGLDKLLYELEAYINDVYAIYTDMCKHRDTSGEE